MTVSHKLEEALNKKEEFTKSHAQSLLLYDKILPEHARGRSV